MGKSGGTKDPGVPSIRYGLKAIPGRAELSATGEKLMASVRYFVNDVENSVRFYTETLGFKLEQRFGPAMAIVQYKDLSLWLAGPQSSAAKAMPDGSEPRPGGWNRFVLQVEDLNGLVTKLKSQDVPFRNDIVGGPGGHQVLCEDPSGNVIELFQPA